MARRRLPQVPLLRLREAGPSAALTAAMRMQVRLRHQMHVSRRWNGLPMWRWRRWRRLLPVAFP